MTAALVLPFASVLAGVFGLLVVWHAGAAALDRAGW